VAGVQHVDVQVARTHEADLLAHCDDELDGRTPTPGAPQQGEQFEAASDAGLVIGSQDGAAIRPNHPILADDRLDPHVGANSVHVRRHKNRPGTPARETATRLPLSSRDVAHPSSPKRASSTSPMSRW
jgi:hypothetical protein